MVNKETFSKWLSRQVGRNDPVGDLARDARDDGFKGATYDAWETHLMAMQACDGALQALVVAWQEYTLR